MMLAGIVYYAFAIGGVGWFFVMLNKLPTEIARLRELKSEEHHRDVFWGETVTYLITWAICLGLFAGISVPTVIKAATGWSQFAEFIKGFNL
ncbi:MAG: hypothetical protein GC154_14355 [bacterium]|nr:hypothetical protein [bacterium]